MLLFLNICFSPQAPVLRRLRPRLPHVLPGAAHQGAARGVLELQALPGAVPQEAVKEKEPSSLASEARLIPYYTVKQYRLLKVLYSRAYLRILSFFYVFFFA